MNFLKMFFVCLSVPFLVAAICMGKEHMYVFLSIIAGMGSCMLSAYINTFLSAAREADILYAITKITPAAYCNVAYALPMLTVTLGLVFSKFLLPRLKGETVEQ